MKSEIISVGTELLLGHTVNTNASYLSRQCAKLGIDVYYHTVVGDNVQRLKEATKIALNRSDLIIYTGGLGPTSDDITKEVVCELINIDLELNNENLNEIRKYFNNIDATMTSNNVKQAYTPKGSIVLKNDVGTAPGAYINYKGKIIVFLPGPPMEMKVMFDNYAIPLLGSEYIIESKIIKTIGIGESQLEDKLKTIIANQTNPSIATYAKEGQVDITITAKEKDQHRANELINQLTEEINVLIGEYIYSYNGKSIEEVFYDLLKKNNMSVAFCESCTGGLLTSRFTKIPGVSEVLDRGIVTYSNKSKIEELGVKEDTLSSYGAVSEQTAMEMAYGLLKKTDVDIAISTTGIAGPDTDYSKKPVGLVYIGIAYGNNCYAVKYHLTGNRIVIQNKAANLAFNEGRKIILNNY